MATLGYGIVSGEAAAEDEVEQVVLVTSFKVWKAYKFALGKVATQGSWPLSPSWATAPVIPDISADPNLLRLNYKKKGLPSVAKTAGGRVAKD